MNILKILDKAYQESKYQLHLASEFIYARCCLVCHEEIDDGCLCQNCRPSFILNKSVRQQEYLDGAIFLLKYQNQLQVFIHKIKFNGERNLLPMLSEEAELALDKAFPNLETSFDIITCIPTSKDRRKKRGFDVPQEIFSFLDEEKWQPDILKRVFKTAPLFDLEPALRKQEIAGCFVVHGDVQGKTILLCDDIFTTGSTMNEAAKELKAAGARSVYALALTASKDNW